MSKNEYIRAFGEVLGENEKEVDYVENLLRVMQYRGHGKLLPSIIKELEAGKKHHGADEPVPFIITVAREGDEEMHKKEIEEDQKLLGFDGKNGEIVVDERLVGGYRIESADALLDRTYKQALIEIYRKMVG